MRVSSIRIEEGVIVGIIVAFVVGALVWAYQWIALEKSQAAAADSIRNGYIPP